MAFFRGVMESATYQDALRKRLLAGKAPHVEKYALEILYGKPKEHLEHTGKDGGPIWDRVTFYLPFNDREPT